MNLYFNSSILINWENNKSVTDESLFIVFEEEPSLDAEYIYKIEVDREEVIYIEDMFEILSDAEIENLTNTLCFSEKIIIFIAKLACQAGYRGIYRRGDICNLYYINVLKRLNEITLCAEAAIDALFEFD